MLSKLFIHLIVLDLEYLVLIIANSMIVGINLGMI